MSQSAFSKWCKGAKSANVIPATLHGRDSFVIPTPNDSVGNKWYVRPAGGSYGTEDGTSYDNAWDGFASIVWGGAGVNPGDTLYVAGTHNETLTVGASGTDGAYIKIYNYVADAGTIDGNSAITSCVDINSCNYIIVDGLDVREPTTNGYIVQGTSHHVYIRNCTSTLSGNQAFQMLDTATVYYQNIVGSASTDDGFSMHDATTAYIDGAIFSGNAEGINIIATSVLYAKNVTISTSTSYGIRLTTGTPKIYFYASSNDYLALIDAGGTAVFEGSVFTHPTGTAVTGVVVNKGTLTAINNKIHGSDKALVSNESGGTSLLVGNLFYNMGGSNIAAIYNVSGTVGAYNNTIIGTNKATTGIGYRTANLMTGTFSNNIVKTCKYGTFNAGTGTINGANNDFYDLTTQHQGAQSLSGTLTVDPLLNADYTLQAHSPMRGAGADAGYQTLLLRTTDWTAPKVYATARVDGNYDIGAYARY